jgi:hypothetical protein
MAFLYDKLTFRDVEGIVLHELAIVTSFSKARVGSLHR